MNAAVISFHIQVIHGLLREISPCCLTNSTCSIPAPKTGMLQVCLAKYSYTAACCLNELVSLVFHIYKPVGPLMF